MEPQASRGIPRSHAYPKQLTFFGVPEKKATAPRVEAALEAMEQKEGFGLNRQSLVARFAICVSTVSWFLIALAVPFEANSVLIATGDGTGNTTTPTADPGFANVGRIGGLAGTYVRNGWVLTANHVGEKKIHLLGVPYEPILGSRVRFQNADLIAFKLQTTPPLPDLQLASAAPTLNTLITLAGKGRHRGTPMTWNGHDGWNWGTGGILRWGTNRISKINAVITETQSFEIKFDDIPEPPDGEHEAALTEGDSGGGAFTGSGASAELTGILFGRTAYFSQPANTSLYGNEGLIVDLFAYRSAILAVIDQPDCSNGLDDDGDGLTDYPSDRGCVDAFDSNERGAAVECDNGIDDDADTLIDYPSDPGCHRLRYHAHVT